jgi:hypothetical protein
VKENSVSILVICGMKGCENREIRPLKGDDYSFVRRPGTKQTYVPCCEACSAKAHEDKKKEILSAHQS